MIYRGFLALCLSIAWVSPIEAQETCQSGSTCIPSEAMQVFVQLLKDKKCQQENIPTFQLDPVTVIADTGGRVYFSGSEPSPYTLRMTWCNYEVTAVGKVDLVVARKEPPIWGFRFRPKFAETFLLVDAVVQETAVGALDVGVLWDFLYWRSLNLNFATGFRSAGVGLGVDMTHNFGVYTGYAFSWWTLKHNPQIGLYFAF